MYLFQKSLKEAIENSSSVLETNTETIIIVGSVMFLLLVIWTYRLEKQRRRNVDHYLIFFKDEKDSVVKVVKCKTYSTEKIIKESNIWSTKSYLLYKIIDENNQKHLIKEDSIYSIETIFKENKV